MVLVTCHADWLEIIIYLIANFSYQNVCEINLEKVVGECYNVYYNFLNVKFLLLEVL
jgi:hypothetical protein